MHHIKHLSLILLLTFPLLSNAGCGGGGGGNRKINTAILGTNAFVNDPSFGTISQQFNEVQDTLGIHFVRVLFNWNDMVQASPGGAIDFSFYDDIVQNLPPGMDALVILNGLPSWMSSSSNWINGDPRATFVELWVKPVITRYAGASGIVGWEIWNEPNMTSNPDNVTLDIATSPQNYVSMLADAYTVSRSLTPTKLVVTAAVTSINENFPSSLDYNKDMKAAGAEQYADRWGVHYYGKELIHVLIPGGVKDFLDSLNIPIWITESGEKGVTEQLSYAEEVWPFLTKNINNIERLYQYQFAEDTPASTTYGLRNLTPGEEYSDLYNYLAEQNQ